MSRDKLSNGVTNIYVAISIKMMSCDMFKHQVSQKVYLTIFVMSLSNAIEHILSWNKCQLINEHAFIKDTGWIRFA